MSYVRLLPTLPEYSKKFQEFNVLDFKIIKAMNAYGVSNLSKLAEALGVPQQTVNYHVKKFDRRDIVRFRALVDESKLGLKSFAVMAHTPLGKEAVSSRAMTCFPLWRYLAIVDGWRHANYVRYVVPPDKERDLKAFLEEVKNKSLITEFNIVQTTSPNYPLLNLDLCVKKRSIPVFDWAKWSKDLASFSEAKITEPTSYEKAAVDLYDLIILRCLEINARTSQRQIVKEMARILEDKKYKKFIPLISRRLRNTLLSQGLIRGYRTYLFPNPEPTALFIMYHIVFANSSDLRKFVAGLAHLPYNTGYEKVLGKDELFIRFIIPAHEFTDMRQAVTDLAMAGQITEARLLIGDLMRATWDNVEIHRMYKDGTWNFSYGIAVEMLENVLKTKQ
jgi:DNA-binding Lrp family transcriptional regulator